MAVDSQGSLQPREYLLMLVKLVLVPGAFAWLVYQLLDAESVNASIRNPALLLVALMINQAALCLFAIRMKRVLGVFSIPLAGRDALRIHLQSMFYFFVFPMTVGLEIARFAKIKTAAPASAAPALASALVVDRLLGAVSALVIALALTPFVEFPALPEFMFKESATIFLLVGATILAGLIFWRRTRAIVAGALQSVRGQRRRLFTVFVISLGMHSFFCAGIYFAAAALGLPVTLIGTSFAVSAAMLFVAVPVSFAGAGPAEAAAAIILVGLGIPLDAAVTLALLIYLARFVGAIQGGIWEMYEGGVLALSAALHQAGEKND